MDKVMKFGKVAKGLSVPDELALVNAQSVKELTADDVFVFRVVACDDQVDRDFEHFSPAALEQMAKLFVGKPLISDHQWSAKGQIARIYAGDVEDNDGVKQLVLRCYMIRTDTTKDVIDAIEAGILREVSVGGSCKKAVCDICGNDKAKSWCAHRRGQEYDGKTCTITLDDTEDAYELSFVAVPAQPGAGVVKSYGGENVKPEPEGDGDEAVALEKAKALALLALEDV